MKSFRLLFVLLPLLLTACGPTQEQLADYRSVQRSNVSSAIYDKMMHEDPLSLNDIMSLSRAHVNDGVILRYIRDRETIYNLNSQDVTVLRNAGVSQSIIDYMLQTPRLYYSSPPVVVGIGLSPYPYGPYYYGGGYYRGYYGGGYYRGNHWH